MAAKLTAQKKDALLPPGPHCSETKQCVTVYNSSSNSGETVKLSYRTRCLSHLDYVSSHEMRQCGIHPPFVLGSRSIECLLA